MNPRELADMLRNKSKLEMRRLIRDYRDQMPREEVERGSSRAHRRLFSLPEFIESDSVMFYMSFRNELDTRRMIERSLQIGKKIFLPRIVVSTSDLDVYHIVNLDEDTAPGILGIIEPGGDAEKCEDLDAIDLCIVPGLAFDRRGHRIGWGRGFYDRFLPRLSDRTITFGMAYDFQVVDIIETHDMDVPLTGLVTESELLRFE
jgi:5-formyltetrahydrofolate cyclo-ligase